ncbi:MAG: methyltransferase domain-containing protein [Rhodospirillaceae bacterium]|jgi:SAM-dependent methyltransferase|nr:methyltransferase domain-containing protein [Rhodospirillaceae bacterium]
MVGTAAIENNAEKFGLIRQVLTILFYPPIFIFRLLFRRSKEAASSEAATSTKSPTQGVSTPSHEPQETWSDMRLEICERLWGDGCLNPFNSEYAISALRLLDVDESNSLLQLGAGLGGTSRAMVDQTGIWITGYEAEEKLLDQAKIRNQMAGTTKKAAISKFRPDAPKFKANGFNVAMLYEFLTAIEDKEVVIQSAASALRANGHFIMVDYVLPGGDPPTPAMINWFNFEPEKPKLWTARRTYDTIKDAGLDVRIAEDFTKNYRSMVLTGWLKLLSGLTKKELNPEFATALIKECEYWLYRVAALDSGGLKVYRYHAIKD